MSKFSEWLDRHGLGKYAEVFADNDIDLDVVPELTDADLEKLGVSLGDRRRFLKAAASLDVSTRSEPSDSPGAESRDAERRQITVMFVDLVGSTELSTKLDPEDMREVIGAYHRVVAAEVERFDGHVAKYMGDGVLAYFGWPKAHEDEAERAVRTGIKITAAVTAIKLPGNQPLSARVGIATGLVVVGDLVGKADAREHSVVGDTPNLAARLQALSGPGQVVIGDNTRQLLGDLFELADLGNHELKGFEAPVHIWRVVGESSVPNRFEAMHGSALTPLVGRDQELALLRDRWLRATESEGQVVLLSGEPGIGKSRLMRALCDCLIDKPHTRLNYFCSAYHTNSALHPVIGQLERAAEIVAADDPKARLGKLEGLLGRAFSDVASVAPVFAALLSIDGGERYPPIKLNPEVQKARTFEVLIAQIEALANRSPVLAILEDAHWLDPTSSELFGVLIDRIQGLKVLLIVTFRPEFVPPWVGHAHVTSLSLNRLGGRQVRKIIESITYGKSVPREIEEQIAAKTDGVPLFVEELTKTVLESGLLHEVGGAFVLDGPLPPLAVPTTLHDSLMARLDRRAPIREIAQIGAVIGREFSYDLLATLTGGSPIALDDALAQLAGAEIIFRRGAPPQATYLFKHALVQDAAYQSLLRSRRQQLHSQIADVLERRGAEPELLAHHFTEAGLTERAVVYWHEAGVKATDRSANLEAVNHLTKGLDILKKHPDTADRKKQELAFCIALGVPTIATEGQAVPRTMELYSRARDLCKQLDDSRQLAAVSYGLWAYYIVRGELLAAQELAEECLRTAETENDTVLLVGAHFVSACVPFHQGEFRLAREHCEHAVEHYVPTPPALVPPGADFGIFAKAYLSHALWHLGYPDKALMRSQEALADATNLAHPFSSALAATYAATLMQFFGNKEQARQQADAAIAVCREFKFSYYLAWATIIRGWSLQSEDDEGKAITQMRAGLAALRTTGARLREPYYLGLLAEASGRTGKYEEGLELAASALESAGKSGERFYDAELYRIQGELLLRKSAQTQGESSMRQALKIARSQKARAYELRAATSLARNLRDKGMIGEADKILAPVYGSFTEGFDMAELKEAKALLAELS